MKFKAIGSFTLIFLIGFWQYRDGIRSKNQTLIVQQLRQVGQLHTVIFTGESLIPTQAERNLGTLVIGKTELVYLARGEVRAGINLEQLKPEHIKQSPTGLEILLPPPEILDSKIDIRRSQVKYYNRGFLSLGPDVAPELQSDAERRAQDAIVASACKEGILAQANLQTQVIVTQLLQAAGYENVSVKTQKPFSGGCL
ncbi:DUF4230 domain-containing protein [Gloeocapsa sp. PCC 73106]|uniref:DUF4230 domain-containing protein n=1 Tax=Gloeocapsa sp. PCC 73106 TaxID=102232 RepID=UPI0002AC94D2|nr:DUF4230 domain-containing protein [Gloeocapsa sp. PCC 73106]ELR96821.1 hypothetical protein GLO73106DRAFT_00006200 [Gloeocapsa sp. PCC 73106]